MKNSKKVKNKNTKNYVYPAIYNTSSFIMSLSVIVLSLLLQDADRIKSMLTILIAVIILLAIILAIIIPCSKKNIDAQETDELTKAQNIFLKIDNVITWFSPITFLISVFVTILTTT